MKLIFAILFTLVLAGCGEVNFGPNLGNVDSKALGFELDASGNIIQPAGPEQCKSSSSGDSNSSDSQSDDSNSTDSGSDDSLSDDSNSDDNSSDSKDDCP